MSAAFELKIGSIGNLKTVNYYSFFVNPLSNENIIVNDFMQYTNAQKQLK